MPDEIPHSQYTWEMLEMEREISGEDSAKQVLESIAEETESILRSHGMDIPEVDLMYDPERNHLDPNVEASVSYTPRDPKIDGLMVVGAESQHRPDSLKPRISDTLAEEYMHIQYESVEDFDSPTSMGIDILGSVWSLYSQDLLDDEESIEEVAYHSKHGYSATKGQDYGEMVEEGIYDLIEDFEEANNNRLVMEHILSDPTPLFDQYNENKL